MKISYDKEADAISIWFDGVESVKTMDLTEDIFFDVGESGRLAGIEILHASQKANVADFFRIQFAFPNNRLIDLRVPEML